MRFCFASLLFVFFTHFVSAQNEDSVVCKLSDVGGRYREHNADFDSLKIDVKFLPKEGKVIGREVLSFRPIQPLIDSLFLDAPGISFSSVTINDKTISLRYTTDKKGLSIYFSKPLNWNTKYKLIIDYSATPRKGLYFVGWNDNLNLSRKQIWTQGQGIDNRYWFPHYDDANDKVITETIITFDKNYTVISNGNLVSKKLNADSTLTWHYRMTKPHASYLVMLAIDKYAHKDVRSENGIVSRQYYYADRPQDYEPTYRYSKEMMDFLEKEIGVPYPWKTYANVPVQDFMYGAMENTTATIFGDFYLQDERASMERSYVGTNAHELTHQWFGDYITEWSPAGHWLHESFATYYAKIFCREVFGEDNYEWAKYIEAQSAIAADLRDRFPVAHSRAGTSRHYPKGSFVIDMLRYVVGDSVFHKSVKAYLKKHAYNSVDTRDFYLTFMETAGINLDWFFNQWIYHSGFPELKVRYEKEASIVRVIVEQTQKTDSLTGLFRMPITIAVYNQKGNASTGSVTKNEQIFWIKNQTDTFSIPFANTDKIGCVIIDPGYRIIKKLQFERNYSELIFQAEKAENMIDRYLAFAALRDTALSQKQNDLLRLYETEKSLVPRQEIMAQLGKDTTFLNTDFWQKALTDTNFQIRRTALENANTKNTALLPFIEKLLADTSYITIEIALRKLANAFPEKKKIYLTQTQNIHGISENVRITNLELQKDEKNEQELFNYVSGSYEFRTRIRAMETIQRLNVWNDVLIDNLLNALFNPNGRLSGVARNTIDFLMKDEEFKAHFSAKTIQLHKTEWQSELLKKWAEK